jgi:ferredoxin
VSEYPSFERRLRLRSPVPGGGSVGAVEALFDGIRQRFRRNEASVRYGFVIDQRKCIGCHACTVACKTEHEIPLGQFRTWVKYVDKGEYPSTTREFGVIMARAMGCRAR